MSLADVHISHASGEELGATVIGAMPSDARGVVLDLSAVEYLDSAGIYVIHGMRASLQARGQRLLLVIPADSPVHDTLRLSGAQHPGEVVGELDAALRALDGSRPRDP